MSHRARRPRRRAPVGAVRIREVRHEPPDLDRVAAALLALALARLDEQRQATSASAPAPRRSAI